MALVDGAAYERAMETIAFLNGVAKGLSEENDALKGERDRAFITADEVIKENDMLKAALMRETDKLTLARDMADDLAADLELFNPKAPALARWREMRGR